MLSPKFIFKATDISSCNPAANNLSVKAKLTTKQYAALINNGLSDQDNILPNTKPIWHYMGIKCLMDIFISILGLGLVIPMYPIIALINRLTSPGPVIFKQERVGLNGEVFTIYKFRTMVNDAEKHTGPTWCKPNDSRITPLGKVLRKTRLDEFPQFMNVLKREMSFIGPRPERPHFVDKLKDQIPMYLRRIQVKPGITGWAQIHVNYDRTIEDVKAKLAHDLYYIDNMSLYLDFIILLKTVKIALIGKGAH